MKIIDGIALVDKQSVISDKAKTLPFDKLFRNIRQFQWNVWEKSAIGWENMKEESK